jgi:hypothetical protein
LANAQTYQEQIAASKLSLSVGSIITGISWRLNGATPAGVFSGSWATYQIQLAQANQPVMGLNPGSAFASNMLNPVLVYNAPLAVFLTSGSSPNAFGAPISFTNPYTYQGGDLILYYTHSTGTGTPQRTLDAAGNDADYNTNSGYKALQASGLGAPISSPTLAAVVVVDVQVQVVPEPGTLVLTGFGLLTLLGYRLWRRRVVR